MSRQKLYVDILPALKGGDSHFTEASQCALTCTQDLQLLHGLTPPVRRPKHCGRRLFDILPGMNAGVSRAER
jgi:hypothetical protein